MPPKKRQSTGQVHLKTRRAKVMRACETPEQCDACAEQSHLRRAASRANETTVQREARVEESRLRIVQTRELLWQSNLKL
ncbi:hypothetical protein AVEN_101564-2 [Araneus ventricosus]|uniref:Uncharacterized protein n=1 Tax=Araneus ventricosus TaxID=182803 RepID=A0A4Y2MYE5_ARAVE|nr:hypothetical protein AVEN_101564-2 [Araneus ventricosus]